MRRKWINLLLYSFRQILPTTIRGKMMLWLIVLSLAPVLAVGITAYQNSRAALEREIINKLNAVADNKVSILRGWLQTNLSDVQRLAANRASKDLLSPAFRSRFPDQSAKTGEERIQNARSLLTALQETNPSYADVLIADKDGKVVLSSSSAASKEGKNSGAIGLPKLDMFQPSTSSVYRSPISSQQVFALSSPIHDHEANVVGLAILEVELGRIQDLIGERSGLGETGEVIIVDRDRRMLTQSRLSEESTVLKTISEGNSVRQGLEGKKGEEFEKDYRGIPAVSSYRPVFELGAALVAKIDESEGFSPVTRLRNTVIAIIILTILAASGASWVIARVISGPIHEGVRFARQIAEGDLTANLPTEDKSRMGQLAIALNQMAEDLRQMVSRITEAVQSTNAAATGISAAIEEQERTIAFQAVSINEISSTVNELAQSSNQVGKTAEEVSGQWREVLQATEEGNRSVQKAVEEMNLIKGKASGISQNILKLSEQIQKISSIVQTVANIAEQTNMLALNAGIEAARAGEHGKGFAVVATEVRKLADQSQKAADQIGAIIQEIQAATHSTILAVEEGTNRVESGVQQVLQAGDTIQTVTSTIRKTVDAVQEISLATRQQAIGVDQVSEAMRSIDQGMKETVSGTKQVNVSASQLVTLGRSLQELVKKFQVAKEDRLNQRHGDPD